MKRLLFFALLAGIPLLSIGQTPGNSQVISLDKLKEFISEPSEKVRVINFWATWCAPCIKELPLFEQLNAERNDVEVILVSLDLDLDPDPAKVYRFIEQRGIQSKVALLNAKDPNSWIDQIDPAWSGALPATLIVNPATSKRIFVEKQLHNGDLEKMIMELK